MRQHNGRAVSELDAGDGLALMLSNFIMLETNQTMKPKKLSLADTNWQNVMTIANRGVVVAKDAEAGFFRIADRATNSVIPFDQRD